MWISSNDLDTESLRDDDFIVMSQIIDVFDIRAFLFWVSPAVFRFLDGRFRRPLRLGCFVSVLEQEGWMEHYEEPSSRPWRSVKCGNVAFHSF